MVMTCLTLADDDLGGGAARGCGLRAGAESAADRGREQRGHPCDRVSDPGDCGAFHANPGICDWAAAEAL